MSEAIAFDTHRFVKRLTETGFTEAQAEALADEQVNLLNSNLATRQDILALKTDMEVLKADLERQMKVLKADLERQMEVLKADLERQMEALKADLLKWMIGALIAQGGVIVALIKLL